MGETGLVSISGNDEKRRRKRGVTCLEGRGGRNGWGV